MAFDRQPVESERPVSSHSSSIFEPVNIVPVGDEQSLEVIEATGVRRWVRAQFQAHLEQVAQGLEHIDAAGLAQRIVRSMSGRIERQELDDWLIQTTAMLTAEEPEYSKLAARLLTRSIDQQLQSQGICSFTASIEAGSRAGLIDPSVTSWVREHATELNALCAPERSDLFEYFGLRTVYDRYLLKEPTSRRVLESPQYFFMRVAVGLARTVEEVAEFYNIMSTFSYLPSTPTLFNSATRHPQMSSCYLLDSPNDSLEGIYGKYTDVAMLSKYAGGIGLSFSRVRCRGSLIRGTNGQSNGIVPFLKTLDSSVAAVNQGGKRKGAACVYLETWHADVLEFLMLRDNTGDEAQRTHNLNLAHWIPDLFMRRVEEDSHWSLFDPKDVPSLVDLYGEAFNAAYEEAERKQLARRTIKARELYALMMKTLAQTGNGWMCFKDASNLKANQTGVGTNVVHLSNLCTEIVEVSSDKETAVCNLGSINLARHIKDGAFDFEALARHVRVAVKYLDRVIDINFYPIGSAAASNKQWRPVGLGIMGLQNVFFSLGLAFDDPCAQELAAAIQERIYLEALWASTELARKEGAHPAFKDTRLARGELSFDLWGVRPSLGARWDALREHIQRYGVRNSLLIAIAPTATIASIAGAYECIEPQLSNLFKRETLSGEFLQVNPYLVADLRRLGLWSRNIRDQIKMAEGSIQSIQEIPEHLRRLYRTVWELPQRALIDMAAARGAFIDQSQSLNLFLENPTIGKLSSMYLYAWKAGLKTTYYLRSRSATRINKATVNQAAVTCSLENPESCESCT